MRERGAVNENTGRPRPQPRKLTRLAMDALERKPEPGDVVEHLGHRWRCTSVRPAEDGRRSREICATWEWERPPVPPGPVHCAPGAPPVPRSRRLTQIALELLGRAPLPGEEIEAEGHRWRCHAARPAAGNRRRAVCATWKWVPPAQLDLFPPEAWS